ncbi:MAG TPA: ferritin family protein [Anaeromyxobacteraceae bacterium]|nr:ferritin family protein [Anaeromyxobacteraceae bacterium]
MGSYSVVVVVGLMLSSAVGAPATSTVVNLQRAYEAELNAAAAFSAFARRAEQEGFVEVARLFRAMVLGEHAHAQNHADVMRALGAQPRAAIAEIEVKSTRENLEAAIARETFDRDAMYPTLLGEAREIRDLTPRGTLALAMAVETAHLKMLQAALEHMDSPGEVAGELCVARRSGYVTACAGPAPIMPTASSPGAHRQGGR